MTTETATTPATETTDPTTTGAAPSATQTTTEGAQAPVPHVVVTSTLPAAIEEKIAALLAQVEALRAEGQREAAREARRAEVRAAREALAPKIADAQRALQALLDEDGALADELTSLDPEPQPKPQPEAEEPKTKRSSSTARSSGNGTTGKGPNTDFFRQYVRMYGGKGLTQSVLMAACEAAGIDRKDRSAQNLARAKEALAAR